MPKRIASGNYIAIIGDIIGSKKLNKASRGRLQQRFEKLIAKINDKYSVLLPSKFSITSGDEFQGIITRGASLPELLWEIEAVFGLHGCRVGIGYGRLFTPILDFTPRMDGPALHHARAAIENARRTASLGGMFNGFGELDIVLNSFAHVLWFQRSRWTELQYRVATLLKENISQSNVAEKLQVSRQSISKHASVAGWHTYQETERAWEEVLNVCVDERKSLSIKVR